MSEIPETRYVRTPDGIHIAYQTCGEGLTDLVLVDDWMSHVRAAWDMPWRARVLRRLATFSRLVMFDTRGTGMSDPLPESRAGTLEERIEDLRAVLDAVEIDQAALIGVNTGAMPAILFSATYPQRVKALVILNGTARPLRDVDYPAGIPTDIFERFVDAAARRRAEGAHTYSFFSPSVAGDEEFVRAQSTFGLQALSPGAWLARAKVTFREDVRGALPLVQAPTLVLHRRNADVLRVDHGRYLAQHIAGARYVELEGSDYRWFVGDLETWAVEAQEFLTGIRPVPQADRVLATVLFTDLVDSTRRAAAVGDARWRQILDDHDAFMRRQLERFRGRYVHSTGDGALATFDGPARAIQCALAICEGVRALGLEARVGLHTGEIELRRDDIGGIAVHIAARIQATAAPGEVLVSRTVVDLTVGSTIVFDDRGEHELKGVPGTWRLFAVSS